MRIEISDEELEGLDDVLSEHELTRPILMATARTSRASLEEFAATAETLPRWESRMEEALEEGLDLVELGELAERAGEWE